MGSDPKAIASLRSQEGALFSDTPLPIAFFTARVAFGRPVLLCLFSLSSTCLSTLMNLKLSVLPLLAHNTCECVCQVVNVTSLQVPQYTVSPLFSVSFKPGVVSHSLNTASKGDNTHFYSSVMYTSSDSRYAEHYGK